MDQTALNVPFAHVIEPNSIELLIDEVGPVEWEKKRLQLTTLAMFKHPLGGGASYYVVFLDPSNKTLDYIINAELLYQLFDTKFYNEEVHLITKK